MGRDDDHFGWFTVEWLQVCCAISESLCAGERSLLKSPVFAASKTESGMLIDTMCPRLLRYAFMLSLVISGVGVFGEDSSLMLVSGVRV